LNLSRRRISFSLGLIRGYLTEREVRYTCRRFSVLGKLQRRLLGGDGRRCFQISWIGSSSSSCSNGAPSRSRRTRLHRLLLARADKTAKFDSTPIFSLFSRKEKERGGIKREEEGNTVAAASDQISRVVDDERRACGGCGEGEGTHPAFLPPLVLGRYFGQRRVIWEPS
jgi:hypothetical protein